MYEIISGMGPFLGAVILPLLCGQVTLCLITGNQRINAAFALALGYALGMGILGQLMLILGRLDLPVNKQTISFFIFVYLSVISFLLIIRLIYFSPKGIDLIKASQDRWTWRHKFLFSVILVFVLSQVFFIFFNAFFIPIDQADAFSVYAYKAKVFYYEHSLKSAGNLWPNSYPLQVPLSMAWIAFNTGLWHEGWEQLIFPLNCVALLVIIYNFMKSWTDKMTAFLTLALVVSSLFFVLHASVAYCDFTVMFYTITCLLLVVDGIQQRSVRLIVLAGLMSAFGAAVKLEGIGYWVLELIVLCRFVFAKGAFDPQFILKAIAGLAFPFLMVQCNFTLFKEHYRITEFLGPGHFFVFSLHGLGGHIPEMIWALSDNLLLSGNWNVLWLFLFVMALASRGRIQPLMVRFFSFALVLFILEYVMAVDFTTRSFFLVNSSSVDSLSRLLLHFYPLCPLLIGFLVHQFFKNRRAQFVSS